MKALHDSIERNAKHAIKMAALERMRAMIEIDELLERYRIEDAFRNRSLAQKKRWENFRKFNGGGK